MTPKTMTNNQLTDTYPIMEAEIDRSDHRDYAVINVNDQYLVVGWLEHDDDPLDFFDGDGLGDLIQFSDRYSSSPGTQRYRRMDPREILEDLTADKKIFFLLDRYEHSCIHYSLTNTRWYPHQDWDTSVACAVWVPNQDVQARYHRRKFAKGGKQAALEVARQHTEALVESYSQWANGEVYGYIVKVFDLTDGSVVEDGNSCWGFIGDEYAKGERDSVVTTTAERLAADCSTL